MSNDPNTAPGWDDAAAALALLRAAQTGDSEGVATLMTVVAHRSLVIGLLALLMQLMERAAEHPDDYVAAMQQALVAQGLED